MPLCAERFLSLLHEDRQRELVEEHVRRNRGVNGRARVRPLAHLSAREIESETLEKASKHGMARAETSVIRQNSR